MVSSEDSSLPYQGETGTHKTLTKYGLVGNDLIPLPGICYITHVFCSQDTDKALYTRVWYLIHDKTWTVLYNGNHGKDTYLTKYGLVGNYWLPTHENTCSQASCTKIDLLRQSVSLYQIYTSHICFCSQEKSNFLLYKLVSVSPRINLYLYSGNYGEDTISNHIVGSYLFPGRCRIRHWQGIWGM